MYLDCVCFYVENAATWRDWFVQVMGFESLTSVKDDNTHTEIIRGDRQSKIKFALYSPLNSTSFVAQYLNLHPPGIGELIFKTENIEKIWQNALVNGATIRQSLENKSGIKSCKFTDLVGLNFTIITETTSKNQLIEAKNNKSVSFFEQIDHLVLNVERGKLQETVNWYQEVFGFIKQQSFTIQTELSGLYSQVLIDPISGLQFPINEPTNNNSQIQEFIQLNCGAGIQHLALKTKQIVRTTNNLRKAGLDFLSVPDIYYLNLEKKSENLNLSTEEWQKIKQENILVDVQNNRSLLLQIFTKPLFIQPTFFLEIIERRHQAKGFGAGNFQALFAAIEREQLKRKSLSK